jgi:hypothetical protein
VDILEMEILNDNSSFESEINFSGEYINTLTKEQIKQAVDEYLAEHEIRPKSKISEITLFANKWQGISERRYEQVVVIDDATESSQVDLTPSDEQLDIFYDKEVILTTKNVDGVITVILIGEKLENDYTIQVTIAEVEHE